MGGGSLRRHMKHVRNLLGVVGSIAVLGVSSCAMIPAKLVPVHALGKPSCPLHDESLHDLMEIALREPNVGNSAHALGHFVEVWHKEYPESVDGVIGPETPVGREMRYRVKFRTGGRGRYVPSYFDEISPALDYSVKRIDHHQREGLGCPMKAFRENINRESIERYYPPEGITREVTVVIHPGRISGGIQSVEIELLDALHHEKVIAGSGVKPLAADFSVALAALLERTGDLHRAEFLDVLTPDPKHDPQLYLMEPYDPGKEPLIMIHGLLDSPLTWAKLTNRLRSEPELRQRYQIWHYLYNTSAPALYSGRILRLQYRELRHELDPEQGDRAMQRTTLLTHSMGGILARSLITDPGQAFWDAGFTRPLNSLELNGEDREALIEAFLWKPESSVRDVIFICVPHKGSEFADNPVGKLGKSLVKPPSQFRAFYERISEANPGAFTQAYQELGEGKMDSVSALSPKQPTLHILSDLPLGHDVRMYSILGNRGKGGPVEESSDGVVEYWSSHIDGVESETFVPYGHRCLSKEETIDEVVRILGEVE